MYLRCITQDPFNDACVNELLHNGQKTVIIDGNRQHLFNVFAVLGQGSNQTSTSAWYLMTFEHTTLSFMDVVGYWLERNEEREDHVYQLYAPIQEVRILTGCVLEEITSAVKVQVLEDAVSASSRVDIYSFINCQIPVSTQLAMKKLAIEESLEDSNTLLDDIGGSWRIGNTDSVDFSSGNRTCNLSASGLGSLHDECDEQGSISQVTAHHIEQNVGSILVRCKDELSKVKKFQVTRWHAYMYL